MIQPDLPPTPTHRFETAVAAASERQQPAAREGRAQAAKCALVLSGGGAKGVFESGVLHALGQVDFRPQVITGSSVGAINAVAFAESLAVRREQGEEAARAVLERALELWQRLDVEHVADVDGTIGVRVWALCGAGILLGLALLAGATWTDLRAGWMGFLLRAAAGLIGLAAVALGAFSLYAWSRLPKVLRAHVRRGLVNPEPVTEGSRRSRTSAGPVAAGRGFLSRERLLRWVGLAPSLFSGRGLRRALTRIVPETRRLSEYESCDLDVRLTRANVRTGRTEISERLTAAEASLPDVDRGRRMLGDPRAVAAALASSAFPSGFPPVPAVALYPEEENPQLYAKLTQRARAKRELGRVFGERAKSQYRWLVQRLDEWTEREPALLRNDHQAELLERIQREFYGERASWSRVSSASLLCLAETREWPQLPVPGDSRYSDRYFDGGILDNTPLSAALTAIRDAESRRPAPVSASAASAESAASPTQKPIHEMVVVLLAPLPRARYVTAEEAERLEGPALGLRALRLQAERRLADDVKNAERIDRMLAEKGRMEAALSGVTDRLEAAGVRERGGAREEADRPSPGSWAEVLGSERPQEAADAAAAQAHQRAPSAHLVRVRVTRVYPNWDLPWLLALDDRLGFDSELAREFQARGCRDTLAALADRHAPDARAGKPLPPQAHAARRLLGGTWEEAPSPGWTCRADVCSLRSACQRVAAQDAADARAAGLSVSAPR